jgi:hypothetical protein
MNKFRILLSESHHPMDEIPSPSCGISKCMKALRLAFISKPVSSFCPKYVCFARRTTNSHYLMLLVLYVGGFDEVISLV